MEYIIIAISLLVTGLILLNISYAMGMMVITNGSMGDDVRATYHYWMGKHPSLNPSGQ